MRIQHNIASLNTLRNFSTNHTYSAKALEKLSTGFNINRAGDDAAGLAISEKMRAQIQGLTMAQKMTKTVSHLFKLLKVRYMKFTKSSILQQAAQSMLSQANQQPQSLLQLLA
ncbi:flagellin [Metalysinibacillus jejuensis]|uniref:flagellin N-terminal helical domain-containing protein n=1 Tax=Metalysinibacillus jejuensis TaxID=914327 RepID=UPI000D3C5A2D|nr:flagellin [Metalysinibacillus jejuensis]